VIALEAQFTHDERRVLRAERRDGQERGNDREERAPRQRHATSPSRPEAPVIDGIL
jgi:hypothetical protein